MLDKVSDGGSSMVECPPPNRKVGCSIHDHWVNRRSTPWARAFTSTPSQQEANFRLCSAASCCHQKQIRNATQFGKWLVYIGRRGAPTNGSVRIINFENAASHKYVVQKGKGLWTTRSEMSGHWFLVLIQKWHKLCFENSGCKLLSFNNSANSSSA